MTIRLFMSCKLKFCVISGFFVIQIAWFSINCYNCFAVTKSKHIHMIEKRSLQIWRFCVEITQLTMVQLMADDSYDQFRSVFFLFRTHFKRTQSNSRMIQCCLVNYGHADWSIYRNSIRNLGMLKIHHLSTYANCFRENWFATEINDISKPCMRWVWSKIEVCRNVNVINSIAFVQSWN